MTAANVQGASDDGAPSAGITRRAAIRQVTAMLGGVALVGGDRLGAVSVDDGVVAQAAVEGVGTFSAADIAFLDEVADTILPDTSTPGAKAAKTGAFMALMVTDVYTERNRQVFREGMRQLDEACRAAAGTSFMQAPPARRLTLLEALDREQRTAMEERAEAPRSRAPAAASRPEDEPPHYFRMMKELALLGYFTSEIGYRQAMRYIESPGRFDPCAPHAPGDRTWATHA
ncbi:MAG: gluconate 2-dehydrogenase subunit 3 family protein [Acidobacteria bacterium]|nr:gluconate 2-dehydrogenase subunit 3 family protein [Acidobacteriota bacterium]